MTRQEYKDLLIQLHSLFPQEQKHIHIFTTDSLQQYKKPISLYVISEKFPDNPIYIGACAVSNIHRKKERQVHVYIYTNGIETVSDYSRETIIAISKLYSFSMYDY